MYQQAGLYKRHGIGHVLGQQGLSQLMSTLESEVKSELYLTGYADG